MRTDARAVLLAYTGTTNLKMGRMSSSCVLLGALSTLTSHLAAGQKEESVFDLPPGPQFSAAQKEAQRALGAGLASR